MGQNSTYLAGIELNCLVADPLSSSKAIAGLQDGEHVTALAGSNRRITVVEVCR